MVSWMSGEIKIIKNIPDMQNFVIVQENLGKNPENPGTTKQGLHRCPRKSRNPGNPDPP